MIKKSIILLGLGFVFSIGVVAVLIVASGLVRDRRNSFLRLYPSHPVFERHEFDLHFNSYYLAGGSSEHIYLGNYSSPLHLLVLNRDLTDSTHALLKIAGVENDKFWSARVLVDSPRFYFHDGAVPRIYQGMTTDWKAELQYDSEYFLDIEPINASTFLIKSLMGTNESMLGKLTPDSLRAKFHPEILEKQIDGVFCVDGTMRFSKEIDRLVYTYRYRNQFIVMDTNLNVVARINTIDTTSKAKIKIATIKSTNSRTLASPPFVVNNQTSVYKQWLFVNSSLLALNDDPDTFNTTSIIDVYDIVNAKYLFSFYIGNNRKNERLREFRVYNNRLFVMFGTSVIMFELRDRYFDF